MRGGSKPFKDFQRSLSRLTLSLSLARLTGTAGTTTRRVCFAQVFVHGPWSMDVMRGAGALFPPTGAPACFDTFCSILNVSLLEVSHLSSSVEQNVF